MKYIYSFKVSHVFKHKTLGFDINYVLVRIVLLHKDPVSIAKFFACFLLVFDCLFPCLSISLLL